MFKSSLLVFCCMEKRTPYDNICSILVSIHEDLRKQDSDNPLLKFIDVRGDDIFSFRDEYKSEYIQTFEQEFGHLSHLEKLEMGLGKYFRALEQAYLENGNFRPKSEP